jgi:hypothetical protein
MKMIVLAKYLTALMCVFLGVAAIFFAPDLYKAFKLHLGPALALLFAASGTLMLDSVDNS